MFIDQRQKRVGTFLPLFSLRSNKNPHNAHGTIPDGLVFLDWLEKTKQTAWQMLPLHETHLKKNSQTEHVPSPYKGYGIGIDPKYFLTKQNDEKTKYFPEEDTWIENQEYWLSEYALFCVIRNYLGTDDWTKWEPGLRFREKKILTEWTEKLKNDIKQIMHVQYTLHKEYEKLKHIATEKDIDLIGDISFYLPLQSPLVWQFQSVFQINSSSEPLTHVSGVPDQLNSLYGRQVWGHPVYEWNEKNNSQIFKLWQIRLKYMQKLFNIVRLDHAIGFYQYGIIDKINPENDQVKNGPGDNFFEQIINYCQKINLPVFAEDMGNLDKLKKALYCLHIPGIRILRYVWDTTKNDVISSWTNISSYPADRITYTSTHDTESLKGLLLLLNDEQKKHFAKRLLLKYENDNQFAVALRNTLIHLPAKYCIISLQDWLLTTERINVPGTEKEDMDPNWQYRMPIAIEDLPIISY